MPDRRPWPAFYSDWLAPKAEAADPRRAAALLKRWSDGDIALDALGAELVKIVHGEEA